ncbi:MAG: YggS family pyridoxal phosphate-dependent enzyme [Caldilineaceae bacterium]|nr:YggS family pyridoxal phosphate-dependent enzyme [Caldilineaceae bacterium]
MNSGQLREHLQSRVDAVREQLDRAAEASGRHPKDVTLVAASKTQPDAMVAAAFDCGVRHFGENRPEELARRHQVPDLAGRPIHWHLIGPLQSRKLKLLPPNLTLIQSVDRLKTARLLADTGLRAEVPVPILLQVNPAGEASKQGVALDAALPMAEAISQMEGLVPRGLMAMTPLVAGESELRTLFAAVRAELRRIQTSIAVPGWTELSMGMSQDFELAVREGATIVRIGTSLFGPRVG